MAQRQTHFPRQTNRPPANAPVRQETRRPTANAPNQGKSASAAHAVLLSECLHIAHGINA